jgi:hypothetical protein
MYLFMLYALTSIYDFHSMHPVVCHSRNGTVNIANYSDVRKPINVKYGSILMR